MMNLKKSQKRFGFSLAEALVTLLIVCLITIASIPVLTKKKRNLENTGHGKWMCTLNSDGEHVYWSKSAKNGKEEDPDTWTKTGKSYCTFAPPARARNFAISLSGGGGGGAGTTVAEGGSATWYGDFAVSVPGYYDFLAVGAGSTGAGTTDSDGKSNSGAQGAVVAARVFLDDSVTRITMKKGTVQEGENGSNNSGKAGLPSIITVYGTNKNTGAPYSDELIYAGGGDAASGGKKGKDDVVESRTATKPGEASISNKYVDIQATKCYGRKKSSSSYMYCYINNSMYGGFNADYSSTKDRRCSTGYLVKSYQADLNKFFSNNTVMKIWPEIECSTSERVFDSGTNYAALSASERTKRTNFCAMPGIGGAAREARMPCTTGGYSKEGGKTGTNGLVMASTKYFTAGEGGEAGESSKNLFYPTFETKSIKVTVGAGGKGGDGGNGGDGGRTSISGKGISITPVDGGRGGKLNTGNKNAMQNIAGGNGEKSGLYFSREPKRPLGGLNSEDGYSNTDANGIKSTGDATHSPGFGAGGGAGGINYNSSTGEVTAGKGADGMPGVVLIEW